MNKKTFFNILNETGLSKRLLSTIVAANKL